MSERDDERTIGPVRCTPWCTDVTGHLSGEEPEEQYCHSQPRRIDLGPTPEPLGRYPNHLVLQLYRDVCRPHGSAELSFEPPGIEICPSGTEEVKLSVEQARDLAAALFELCDAAEA